MNPEKDQLWITYMETPVAELEGCGVNIATIALIEEYVGIFVKDIYRSKLIQEAAVPYMAGRRMEELKSGLQQLWKLTDEQLRKVEAQGR